MKRALVVGINAYPRSPLRGCINDASAFNALIETNPDGAPNFETKIETDVPTASALLTQIRELFSGDVDIALFYFSGHGFINDLGGYLVTPDAQNNGEGVPMEAILQIANKSKAKNKVIILDCCHSGALGSSEATASNTFLNTGITILTASRPDEASIEENGHGVFTTLLLEALRGGAADILGNITPASVYAFIDQALGAWDAQRPMFKSNISSFTGLRVIAPRVPKETLRKLIEYFPSRTSDFQLSPEFEDTEPGFDPEKVLVFKNLQKFVSVGLVVPVDEEHMYYAALNSKSCKLTALGLHYWKLAKNKRF